jgi:hypothetical protein
LIDHGETSGPFTFESAFPATPIDAFSWTSSSLKVGSLNAWVIDFANGELVYSEKTLPARARCVRGGAPLGGRRFEPSVVAGDRVVEDTVAGLTWQGCPMGKVGETCASGVSTEADWQGALASCETLDWGGHEDWRLPSFEELRSLADFRFYGPSIDSDAFPGNTVDYFWSSTSRAGDPSAVLTVHFLSGSGAVEWLQEKTNENLLRCVRGGA